MRATLANGLLRVGRFEEAISNFEAAISQNPFAYIWYQNGLTRALILMEKYEEAIPRIKTVLEQDANHIQGLLFLAVACLKLGRTEESIQAIAKARSIAPSLRISHVPGLMLVDSPKAMARFCESLRDAGLPEE